MDVDEFVSKYVEDMGTLYGINKNENYATRLREAYDYIKSAGITTLDQFKMTKGLKMGAFSYSEVTIFDRLEIKEYREMLLNSLNSFQNRVQIFESRPQYGDDLASWGTLGSTPNREDLIKQGFITQGLTSEEQTQHFGK